MALNQNVQNCCDSSLNDDYINYLGQCYFEFDLNIINNIEQNIFNVNTIWYDYRAIELDIRNNQLSEIPESIWQLEQLHTLYLNNNALTEFSFDSLNNLNNL